MSPAPEPQRQSSNGHQPLPVNPPLEVLGFATGTERASPIPSSSERSRYSHLSRNLLTNSRLGPEQFATLVRCALDLRGRLNGSADVGTIGGVALLELRVGWARSAASTWADCSATIDALYQNRPEIVIGAVIKDFLSRLQARSVTLTETHQTSAITACLEQTRLMVIFAGRALKSGDHVMTALSGMKERSFASEGGPKQRGPQQLSAADRQAAFAARQEEARKRAEQRKAALRDGKAVPVKGAEPKPEVDEEKSELLVATVATHSALFESSQPTDEQKRALTQRPMAELEKRVAGRLAKPAGSERTAELEEVRTEMVNSLANRLKDWLNTEVSLAQNLVKNTLSVADVPATAALALTRLDALRRELDENKALQATLEADLKKLAQVAAKAPEAAKKVLSPKELSMLDQILNPPKEPETYELA